MTTKITEKNISSLANAGVNWQAVVVADGSTGTTGVAGRGYFINTTSAAHTFTLPAIATFADTILIKDYAGTFATNALTIARNGHNIQGAANNSEIGTNRASVTLVYVDVTRGWEFVTESNVADLQGPTFITATGGTVTTSGDFKIHSFTGDGCFVVSQVGNPAGGPSSVDYLVVAGGGGGGSSVGDTVAAGGGGAGGFRESKDTTVNSPHTASPLAATTGITLTAQTYPITVGSGGSGGTSSPTTQATSGSVSTFSTITSAGGGRGSNAEFSTPGSNGGSGGGGSFIRYTAGTGNTPPVSPPQGNNGGSPGNPTWQSGGGGGGATAAGAVGAGPGGNGGAGATSSINGTPTARAGGGGGGGGFPGTGNTGGSGGTGGGGTGGAVLESPANHNGTAGTINTGGGGGGGGGEGDNSPSLSNSNGGSGGSGIVIIRYKFQ
jgi:hypothetical protein